MQFLGVLRGLDWVLLLTLLCIQFGGALAVFSASIAVGSELVFYKHLIYLLIGWVVIILVSREKFQNILDLSLYIYLFTLSLLVLVMVVGKEVYGAKRWLDLGFVNVQPSEVMKMSLIVIAAYILPVVRRVTDRKVFLLIFTFLIPAVITLKQPDLGTTIAYFFPLAVMLYARGVPLKYFAVAASILVISSPFLFNLLKDYQKERIMAVLDPSKDYLGSGYQLLQSIIAVGSGGLYGKGLASGTQSQLMFLPESHTDFIFAVIGEDLGFIGSFLLVILFFFLLLRILLYLRFTVRVSERIFVAGVFALMFFQVSINMLMTLGLFPVVGMPLPFVSFGGSSVITFSILIGMLQSIYREYVESPPFMRGELYFRIDGKRDLRPYTFLLLQMSLL